VRTLHAELEIFGWRMIQWQGFSRYDSRSTPRLQQINQEY